MMHGRKTAPWQRWIGVIAAAVTALGGYFAPWAPHPASALAITGLDLAEYVKFLPAMMAGQLPIVREVFYLPLVVGSLMAGLLASRRVLPVWLRALSGMSAIPLALAMLPPAWNPGTLTTPEYRLQSVAIGLCLIALLCSLLLLRFLRDRLPLLAVALLALLAAIGPAWSYLQMRPALDAVYQTPLPLGWGFWLCSLGNLACAYFALVSALRHIPRET